MVLLALPPADHLLIESDRGQFVPSRRPCMMANVRAERLLKIPAEPSPELRIPGAAAQTRVVSMAGIRLGSWESSPAFKGIICDDISEFESSSSQFVNTAQNGIGCPLEEVAQLSSAIRDMVGHSAWDIERRRASQPAQLKTSWIAACLARHFGPLTYTGQGYAPDGQSRVSRCRFPSD